MYDYVVVGAGFFGAVFAHEAKKAGKKVLVIEKRDHIGGNCFSFADAETEINLHKYGPHVFHTSDKSIWAYIRSFADFNDYRHRVLTTARGNVYSLPVNLKTINQYFHLALTPKEAKKFLESKKRKISRPQNLEEKALSLVGQELYEVFIKGYTVKQWGCHPRELPADVIARLPVRTSDNDLYYDDDYQGLPVGGYTPIFEKMLKGVPLELKTDFFEKRDYWRSMAKNLVYTGPVDRYFSYRYGKLRWRSCRFEMEKLPLEDYQGTSVMNYADEDIAYVRIIEPKHFYKTKISGKQKTIIIREYPCDNPEEPYYPMRLQSDLRLLARYRKAQMLEAGVLFGGRLAEYRYYNMDQVISHALRQAAKSLGVNIK